MARWTLCSIVDEPMIEYRWLGRWPTPRWLDRPQMRVARRPAKLSDRMVAQIADWLSWHGLVQRVEIPRECARCGRIGFRAGVQACDLCGFQPDIGSTRMAEIDDA